MFAQDSIDMLISCGIDFEKFEKTGIDIHRFGELMMMSGLTLNDDVKWLSFHGGYDFGYLLKTLTCQDLPTEESAFIELLHLYFPSIFDIKVGLLPVRLIPVPPLFVYMCLAQVLTSPFDEMRYISVLRHDIFFFLHCFLFLHLLLPALPACIHAMPACLPACLPVSAHQFMMTAVEGMHGGLNTLADLLQVERLGPKHQAGSDSLLTATTFFAFVNSHFGGSLDESR
jgi:hypothetical protein